MRVVSDPFLIAHVVHGAPAFDIAEKMDCPICLQDPDGTGSLGCDECDGEGFWWIIPTSGHRAYSYSHCNLYSISLDQWLSLRKDPPLNWPDHYSINDRPHHEATEPSGPSLLERLGLRKPKAPIARRI